MVEGPGCTLKGEKIRGRLVGKTVKNVSGNAVKRKTQKSDCLTSYHSLVGRKLEEVLTLGKELFMFFGDLCLRIHFLMAGSFRVNNLQLDNDYSKVAETASLEMHLDEDVLMFYKSAADVRSAKECKEKFEELKDLDICSKLFSPSRAVVMMMKQTGRMVCDVLLDQLILPGVGNIIKNEALYDSAIRPNTKIENLTEEHISLLVKMTRDFTMIFYKCRRDGKPLRPYEKIYHVGKCRQCDGRVTTTRMGEDNPRVTYFCDHCQDNDLTRFRKQKEKNKSSLLSWMKTNTEAAKDWSCSVCTLINVANQVNCTACFTPKDSQSKLQTQAQVLKPKEKTQKVDETSGSHGKYVSVKKSNYTFRKRSLSNSNCVSDSLVHEEGLCQDNLRSAKRQKVLPVCQIEGLNDNQTVISVGKTEFSVLRSKDENSKSVPMKQPSQQGETTPSKIPTCPGHKRACYMKQCWKENQNRGRWFFVCSLPRGKQCNYFEWADLKFPICEAHGKPCAFRTVMKEGPNNGRKFFACPLGKKQQCGFFQWAIGYDDTV